jgi:phytoene dehydrogenase-like protein
MLVFYFGIKKTFPELTLHNMFFSQNSELEFKSIFETNDIYYDPTIYVNITSKECKSDAPMDCENWFVMISAPKNIGQDWNTLVSAARKQILSKLSRILKTEIEPLIVAEEHLDPRLIESNYNSAFGSVYGFSSNSVWSAFLRQSNFSRKINGLYFCGGSVHPGAGIPLCLLSAKITANLIKEKE